MRFRPSFFPFTEPSFEVDIQCDRTSGPIVKFGEGTDWMEILGCGMVHPNVLRAGGLDPDEYQGFAWGMGLDRIAMLKYGMPDLRDFFNADVRWMSHYGFRPLDVPTLFGGLTPIFATSSGPRPMHCFTSETGSHVCGPLTRPVLATSMRAFCRRFILWPS
jgi:phenylalanyl-tRNA synthetase alpha chain